MRRWLRARIGLKFILDGLWNIEISADPIRHTEEGGDVVRQVRPTEEDVGIEINTFEWLLAHRMIFADKVHIRVQSQLPGLVPINVRSLSELRDDRTVAIRRIWRWAVSIGSFEVSR